MSDQEEPVHSEGRPDPSQDDRREDGLAIFQQMKSDSTEPATTAKAEPPQPRHLTLARSASDDAELSKRRASPYNLRLVSRSK